MLPYLSLLQPGERRKGSASPVAKGLLSHTSRLILPLLTLLLLFASAADAQTASARNLGVANDYNLFVLSNATQSGSDSEGRIAVGGNLTLSSYDVAGHIGNGTGVNLVVGGALETTYGQIHGSTIAGGAIRLHGPTCFGNLSGNTSVTLDQYGTVNGNVKYGTAYSCTGTTVSGTATQGTTALPFSFATERSNLQALSARLRDMPVNGTTTVQYGGITLTGTDGARNVFQVNGGDLYNANNLTINAPAGSTVVINVSGTSDRMQYFGITVNGANKQYVLFNFHAATSLTLNGVGVQGSVLAPYAAVNFSNGNLDGTLVCDSLTGPGQMNHFPFLGDLGEAGPSGPTLTNLTVTPAALDGGAAAATGAVTLSGPAPAGGVIVALSSSRAEATVPANVTIAAGQSTATFAIATTPVTMSVTTTISAVLGGVTKSAPLVINPPPLSAVAGVSLTPNHVAGGESSTGTVTLSGPAPSGGAVVALSSSSASATVPGSVTIAGGQTSATFTLSTTAVAQDTTATITASYNSSSASANLTIEAPKLANLTIAPTTVKGGASATGTVTLSAAAPSGGLSVTLSSSSPKATVPGSVTVSGGATSATFTIETMPVATEATATITATAGGVTKTADLTIQPPALIALSLDPTTVKGGDPSIGTVTLDASAPDGGLSVALSSASLKATVPGSVTVAAGATTATFTVTTVDVPAVTPVEISGTLGGVTKSATLTIEPKVTLTLTVAPDRMLGGLKATGTVTLIGGAVPPSGAVITLSSSDAAATVPVSVTIPEGQSSATFEVTTQAVMAQKEVTLTATYGDKTATALLTLLPDPCVEGRPGILSVTLDPTTVTGVGAVTGTVRLTGAARFGGEVVLLTTSNTLLVQVPAAVFLPSGQDSATFVAQTAAVNATNVVRITATYQNSSASADLTLQPGPASGPGGGGGAGTTGGAYLTPAAVAQGFRLASFAGTWPPPPNYYGISAVPTVDGGILAHVSYPGNVKFASNADGQTYAQGVFVPTGQSPVSYMHDGSTLARVGASIFGFSGNSYGLVEVNNNGTFKRTVAPGTNFPLSTSNFGMDYDPTTGSLVTRFYAIDPVTAAVRQYLPTFATGGRGVALSEDGLYAFINNTNLGFQIFEVATGALVGTVPVGNNGGMALGNGSLSGYAYVYAQERLLQVNIATGQTTILVNNTESNSNPILPVGLSYDGDGNLFVMYPTRSGMMRLYPPPGGFFGPRRPQVIITRDDRTTTYTPITIARPETVATFSAPAAFDLAGLGGRVEEARMERAGSLTHGFEARLDLQPGVRSHQNTDLVSYGTPYAAVETLASPFPYDRAWLLSAPFRAEMQGAFGGLYRLTLIDRVTGGCADYTVKDAPQSGWPHAKNILSFRLAPNTGIPAVAPGRVVDMTVPRPARPLHGQWEIWSAQTMVASQSAPNGWDVEEDHTVYQGVNVTASATAPAGYYEVRFIGKGAPTGGAGSFRVLSDSGSAAVLKPLRLTLDNDALVGTVELDAPAPAGGATVALSANLGIGIPDRVVIPAGATAATFPVTAPGGPSTVRVEASYNGYRVARLNVGSGDPPPPGLSLVALTVSPAQVMGTNPATATVSLSAPAPEGGVYVALASDNAAVATVPATVYVPEGQSDSSILVTTAEVQTITPVPLTAAFAGDTRQALLTVLPRTAPPTVRITQPGDGATFTASDGLSAAVTLGAQASAATGLTVSKVDFFDNGSKVASQNGNGQNSLTVSITGLRFNVGTHRLTATVTDSNGQTATADPVEFYVTTTATTPRPVIRPVSGSYVGSVTVTITCLDAAATIVYTLDGSDPANGGLVYGGPFVLTENTTVKARAFSTGSSTQISPLAQESYNITGSPGNGGGGGLSVRFVSPTDGGTVTQPTNITGEVTTPTGGTVWQMSYREARGARGGAWLPLASGTAPVGTTSVLGRFDPTLLPNGAYEFRLVAVLPDGRSADTVMSLVVEGNMKIGNFRVSYTDLAIPLAGIPITVTRTYDSLDRGRTGDFGAGWSLQMSNIRLQKSAPLQSEWEEFLSGGGGGINFYTLREKRKHYITITFPSGEVYRFNALVSPTNQGIAPIRNARIDYIPVGRTRGTLRAVEDDPDTANNFLFVYNPETNNPGSDPMPVYLKNYIPDWYEPTLFELVTLDGTVFRIDERLGLTYVREPNGNSLTLGPSGISSSTGATVAFTRDGQGRITQITDLNGNALKYQIDGAGNLTAFTDRENKVTAFAYDLLHDLLRITDARNVTPIINGYQPNGRLGSTVLTGNSQSVLYTHGLDDATVPDNQEIVRDPLGNRTVYSFDARGNVTGTTRFLRLPNNSLRSITTSSSYDDPANPDKPTSVTDALGHTTLFTYDGNGSPTSVTDPLSHTQTATFTPWGAPLTITDALGKTTTRTYDAKGNLLTHTDALNNTTTNSYDTRGLLASVTDAKNHVRQFTYDAAGRIASDTDPLGHTVFYGYNGNGNLLLERMTRTNAQGQPEVLQTQYIYDKQDRLLRTIRPDGSIAQNVYDPDGRLLQSIDPLNRITSYTYDWAGRVTRITRPDGTFSQTGYDVAGRVLFTVSPRGLLTENDYDTLGRLVSVRRRDGNNGNALFEQTFTTYDDVGQVTAVTDARGKVTTFGYDTAGRQTLVTDPLGNATQSLYDAMGRLTLVTDALNQTTQYTYDDLGRQTTVITPVGTSSASYDEIGRVISRSDATGRMTSLTYDGLNRLTHVTDAGGFGTTFTYDEVGNRIGQTDANGRVTLFAYDAMGRLIGRRLPLGQTEARTYQIDGRVATRTDFNGHTTTYAYQATTGRLLTRTGWNGENVAYTYTPDGLVASATRNGSLATNYTYDTYGRLTRIVGPAGTITYSYDAAGNRITMGLPSGTVGYEYDALNRMNAVVHPGGARTTYAYNAVGNRLSKTLPGGVTTTYGYDAANRLTSVNNAAGASFTYTLDEAGRRLSATSSVTGTTTYDYDPLGRLVGETASGATIDYTYDAVGNRLSKTVNGVPIGYVYDANDRMLSEGSKTFGYDANGNTIYADGMTLSYDFEDRLIGTSGGSGGATAYYYDAAGNRVQRVVGGQVTSYLVDPLAPTAQVVEERNGFAGALVARYDFGLDLLRMDRGAQSSYYLFDGMGNVAGLTGSGGGLTDAYAYDAFGTPTRLSGSTVNPFLYRGQQYDETEGLYFLRARYYAPGQGRFLSHDPLMGDADDPLSLHRYLYANADPVNFSDPTGMFSLGEQLMVAKTAPLVRGALQVVQGAVTGSLMGAIASGGRAGILGGNVGEAAHTGATYGALFGAISGGLRLLGPTVSGVGAVALRAMGIFSGTQLFAYDLEQAQLGRREYARAAAWDLAWLAFTFATLPPSSSSCFVEGTSVQWVVSDARPMLLNPETASVGGDIKDLVHAWQGGAIVWVPSRDETSSKVEWKRVESAFEKTAYALTTIELAQEGDKESRTVEVITGTPEHPFFTPSGQVPMGQLGVGTAIVPRAGPRLVVKSVTTVAHPEGVAVFNFTVEGTHTYFVGNASGGAWVHNAWCEQVNLKGFSGTKKYPDPTDPTKTISSLHYHFKTHGDAIKNALGLTDITPAEYLKQAKLFANEVSPSFQEALIGNKYLVKYDPATQRLLVIDAAAREIRTFHANERGYADPFTEAVNWSTNQYATSQGIDPSLVPVVIR